MKQRTAMRCWIGYGILAVLLCFLILLNLNIGTVSLSPSEVFGILAGKTSANTAIIWEIRLPRLIAAVILGGALSVSGFLLQTFFSNPIAGPFVLGISSGAKLVVAMTMIGFLSRGWVMSSTSMILAAFVGSMISMGFILLISGKVKKMSLLIICGIMIGYICSAITDFAVTFADDSNIVNLHNWSMGSFSGVSWDNVGTMTVGTACCMALTSLLSKPRDAFRLGEVYAQSMGVNVKLFRAQLILLSSILSATVTAFAGPISFVGIAVPHLVKSLFHTSKPLFIIPASFLGGAVFCLFCDLLARTMFAPTELSIGSVTAVFGAPIVIWMMLHRDKKRQ